MTRLQAGKFESWQGREIFLFSETSTPVLETTHPPVLLIPRFFFSGVKQTGSAVHHLPPPGAEFKNERS
jgi:hypothetical protein